MKKMKQMKTGRKYIDNIWSLDSLDMLDYGREKQLGFILFSVVLDHFSKYG